VALCGLILLSGCASKGRGPREPLPPPQTVIPPAMAPSPAGENPPQRPADEQIDGIGPDDLAADQAKVEKKADPTLIVIDPADSGSSRPPTLAEAAAAERARRRSQAEEPVLKIDNSNLKSYAAGGVLTIAQGSPESSGSDEAEADPGPSSQETYWRDRGLEIRKRWREAADRVPVLTDRVEELRQRFYATDDPAVRDGQVKPQWDKALADLEEAKFRASKGASEVEAYLEEGRRAGALPGWLREGAELEPEPVVLGVEGPIHEPQEPQVYGEPQDVEDTGPPP